MITSNNPNTWKSENADIGSIPSEIGELYNLLFLEPSFNKILGPSITKLSRLHLHDNQVSGDVSLAYSLDQKLVTINQIFR